jgi:hypothetical protein
VKRLGKTELHRIVETLANGDWTEESCVRAENYLASAAHRINIRDLAHELGIGVRIDQHFEIERLFEHSPTNVLAAFDRLRQNELDYQQGRPVTLHTSDKNLRALQRMIAGHGDSYSAQDFLDRFRISIKEGDKLHRDIGKQLDALKDISRALGEQPPKRRVGIDREDEAHPVDLAAVGAVDVIQSVRPSKRTKKASSRR